MSTKKLAILAVVAVVMVILAVTQSRHSVGPKPSSVVSTYLIQGLDPQDIGGITIGKGDKAVKLQRQGKGFEVANKDRYPADAKQINDLIANCMDIKTTQLVSSNPANHTDLGVTEDKAKNVIQFFKFVDNKEVLLTGLMVGNSKEGGQGTYVRLATSNDVYLTPNVPWIRDNATDYVDQELLSVKTEDLDSVTVIWPHGRYVLRKKTEGDAFEMANLPEGKKLKESDARTVATAAGSLRFDDVKKGPDTSLDFSRQFVCKLKDSTLYTLRIAQKDSKTYVTCHAEYTDPNKILMDPTKVDSKEELQKKEAKLLAQEKALKFAARHTGWVYEIPSWKAGYLIKDVNDLLEDLPKPKTLEGANEPNRPVPQLKEGPGQDANSVGVNIPSVAPGNGQVDMNTPAYNR